MTTFQKSKSEVADEPTHDASTDPQETKSGPKTAFYASLIGVKEPPIQEEHGGSLLTRLRSEPGFLGSKFMWVEKKARLELIWLRGCEVPLLPTQVDGQEILVVFVDKVQAW